MTELLAVALKEIHQIRRDRRTLLILTIVPLMQLILLGFAVNQDVRDVAVVVADADQTEISRAFTTAMLAGDTFLGVDAHPNPVQPIETLVEGDAAVVLVVPRGFAADLAAGRPTTVQALSDGGDAQRAVVAQNTMTAFATRWGLKQRMASAPPSARLSPPIEVRARVLYNPTLDSRVFYVPGVAATLLLVVTLVIMAMGMAREKEDGTLEQILVTPMSATSLVIGKVLPYAAIGLLDLVLAIIVGAVVFSVPIRGPLIVLLAGGSLYILTNLGLGLFVASIARTQQQAFMAAFFLLLPMVLLSGFMSPVENMPGWLQPLTLADPVRHMVEILRAVLLKGAGFADLSRQMWTLAGMGVAVFATSVFVLKRKMV